MDYAIYETYLSIVKGTIRQQLFRLFLLGDRFRLELLYISQGISFII
jgi:hypothetical protein